jgi:hypothetical protein
MSRNHRNFNADAAVARAVGKTLTKQVIAKSDEVSLTTIKTGEALLLLTNYMAYRLDILKDDIGDRTPTPFVVKLNNRTNGINRACEEFLKTIEPYMTGPDLKERYSWFSEVIFQQLDSLFDDMHRDLQDPTMEVKRRAKLRYHDPYMTDVKERTAAFEDGYCKGFMDAMGDFMRTVAELGETNEKLTVGIVGGKITVEPYKP